MTQVVLPNGSGTTGSALWSEVYGNDAAILAVLNGDIRNDNLAAAGVANIAHNKLANATAGKLLIANAGGAITATVATGDVTNDSAGVFSIGAGKVTAPMLTTATQQQLGLTNGATTRRDKQTVATSENTASTSFVDLATAGPIVTVNVPTNGLVVAYVECDLKANGGGTALVDLQEDGSSLSGATGILQTASSSFVTLGSQTGNATGNALQAQRGVYTFTPASSGNHNYKLVYKRTGGTSADFQNRKLWVFTMTV